MKIDYLNGKHRCSVCWEYGWFLLSEPIKHSEEHLAEMAAPKDPDPGLQIEDCQYRGPVPADSPQPIAESVADKPEPIALNTITQGDCLDLLPRVASGSVDMVMTSPPYDNLRAYKGYSFDFEGVARELWRVVKPGGVVIWVVGDTSIDGSETGTSFKQALYFKEIGFRLHDTMVWRKTDPPPQVRTTRRYTAAFEYMFVLSKGNPTSFHEIRVPCKNAGKKHSIGTQRDADGNKDPVRIAAQVGLLVQATKPAHNVWDISTGKSSKHPAVFPLELAMNHIQSWSNPGDVVLDPFFGSGTTGVACQQLGRNFIGLEISPEYCEIARSRLAIPLDKAA